MPEIATSSGDGGGRGGRRGRRPRFERAGEVTKAQTSLSTQDGSPAEQPPAFTKPKIGGARRIFGQGAEVADETADRSLSLHEIGGTRMEDMSLHNLNCRYTQDGEASGHLFTAASGTSGARMQIYPLESAVRAVTRQVQGAVALLLGTQSVKDAVPKTILA